MSKIELGAIEFSVEIKDGQPINDTPRMEILQDNLREVAALVPDGKYKWVTVLDIDTAEMEN